MVFPRVSRHGLLNALVLIATPLAAQTASPWTEGKAYKAGNNVSYNSVTYACLQNHTALKGWEPPNVPALWKQGGATPNTAPATPKGLAAAAMDGASIKVSWSVSASATSHDLEVDGSVKSGLSSPYIHSGLTAGTKHSYRVRALNAAGTSAWSAAANATTTKPSQAPAVPSGLKASASTSSSVTLTWSAVSGATSYDLQANGTVISNVGNPFVHSGLQANSSQTYAVRAKNAAGTSAWSSTITASTQTAQAPGIPSGLTATAAGSSQITVTWQPTPGATAFDLEIDGTVKAGATSPFAHTGLAAKSTHHYRVLARNEVGVSAWSAVASATTSDTVSPGTLPKRLLVGYWHNFDNGTGYIRLKDVSSAYDVINVAFAETLGDHYTATFTPYQITAAEFKADVQALQAKGKKVVLSIGGQNGSLILGDAGAKQKFVDSMGALIAEYGFDGLDLDVETGVSLAGDTDYHTPVAPAIVNLISATQSLCSRFGSTFILSMAPEIAYVQGGITAYGGPWGAYLPIIHALRNQLTYLHVQHYNCGGNTALDGASYNQGTPDFEVAMAEMLMAGFTVNGKFFTPLREDQVVIGLPATGSAAPSGGYISPANMKKALDYLIKGTAFGGSYKLQKTGGYPALRGLMTWSVNWDAKAGYEFSTSYRPYFDALK